MNQWIGKVGPQNEQKIHYCIEIGRCLADIAESLDTAQFLLVVEGQFAIVECPIEIVEALESAEIDTELKVGMFGIGSKV